MASEVHGVEANCAEASQTAVPMPKDIKFDVVIFSSVNDVKKTTAAWVFYSC